MNLVVADGTGFYKSNYLATGSTVWQPSWAAWPPVNTYNLGNAGSPVRAANFIVPPQVYHNPVTSPIVVWTNSIHQIKYANIMGFSGNVSGALPGTTTSASIAGVAYNTSAQRMTVMVRGASDDQLWSQTWTTSGWSGSWALSSGVTGYATTGPGLLYNTDIGHFWAFAASEDRRVGEANLTP